MPCNGQHALMMIVLMQMSPAHAKAMLSGAEGMRGGTLISILGSTGGAPAKLLAWPKIGGWSAMTNRFPRCCVMHLWRS